MIRRLWPLFLLASCAPSKDSSPFPKHLAVTCSADAEPALRPSGGVRVYLDISRPMGGYLGQTVDDRKRSALQVFGDPLASSLTQAWPTAAPPTWLTMGAQLAPMTKAQFASLKSLDPALFSATSSPLDLPFADLVDALKSGEAVAGLIISDLVAAVPDVGKSAGGNWPLKPVAQWLAAPKLAPHGVWIVAVRAPYHGFTKKDASRRYYFSESRNEALELTTDDPHVRPLYAVVLSRDVAAGREFVATLAHLLTEPRARGAADEVHAIEISPGIDVGTLGVACDLEESAKPGQPQMTLKEKTSGQGWKCVRGSSVRARCKATVSRQLGPASRGYWSRHDAPPAPLLSAYEPGVPLIDSGPGAAISHSAATISPTGDAPHGREVRWDAALDCAALRASDTSLPATRLTLALPLAAGDAWWQDWSCESDAAAEDLPRTLRLAGFVSSLIEAVRPAPTKVVCDSFFPAVSSK